MERYNLKATKGLKMGFKGCWLVCDKDIWQNSVVAFMGVYSSKQECLNAIEQHKRLMNKILKRD